MKLKINDLSMSYNGKVVLENINLELNNIHSLVIIGPSGGGKSTLLKIIAGLEIPDSGEIYVNDKKIIYKEKELQHYRRTVGMVFQSFNLFPHITAIRNITLPLEEIHGFSPDEAYKNAYGLLERFQLVEHANKRPIQLSGGQQQRVAIARTLAIESQILLLDEPTSALDPELTSEVLDMISELKEERKDIILVTHEMGFARQASDYIIFVADGKIIEQGESEQIFKYPKDPKLVRFLNQILEWN